MELDPLSRNEVYHKGSGSKSPPKKESVVTVKKALSKRTKRREVIDAVKVFVTYAPNKGDLQIVKNSKGGISVRSRSKNNSKMQQHHADLP